MAPNIDIIPPPGFIPYPRWAKVLLQLSLLSTNQTGLHQKTLTTNLYSLVWIRKYKESYYRTKHKKNEDQKIHFMKQLAKNLAFRWFLAFHSLWIHRFLDILLQVFPTLELHWPSKKLLMCTTLNRWYTFHLYFGNLLV